VMADEAGRACQEDPHGFMGRSPGGAARLRGAYGGSKMALEPLS
jgi:hypothetical protein